MVKLLHKTIERGPLQISTSPTSGSTLVFKGVMREPDPAAWLCPLIDEVHAAAVRQELNVVKADLRTLEYANAAAWKGFVYWVKRITDEKANYRLHFLCEEGYRWQEVAMSALRVFGGDSVQVTTTRGFSRT